jgi:uncharacterized protein (TIGR02453 family)
MDPVVLEFLSKLKDNNNREWFLEHKELYEQAKFSFEGFINELIPAIREFDPLIDMITARDCTFRIYRDVRFSKEKSPYKPNMGAYISRGGKNSRFAGYYVHVEPGQSFLAGGLYMPMPDVLKKVRDEIFYNTEEYKKVIFNPSFTKVFGVIDDPGKLVNPPKGFPKDFPDIDLLKLKSFAVMHAVNDEDVQGEGYKQYSVKIFEELYPLNNFFNRIFIEESV